jgi:hypothetical protein
MAGIEAFLDVVLQERDDGEPSKHLSPKSKLCFYLGDGPLPTEPAIQLPFYAVGIEMCVNFIKPYLRRKQSVKAK